MYNYDTFLLIIPTTEKTANAIAFTATTLAPAGIEKMKDTQSPVKKHTTETIADIVTTVLNVLQTRIAVSAGKITILEMSIAPMILMPITIVIAVRSAISVLYIPVCVPVAFAKVSSNVTAKILL